MLSIIYNEDIEEIVNNSEINWELFQNKKIFITGGTGLICGLLINAILSANRKYNLNCQIIALVRNIENVQKKFENIDRENNLKFIIGDVNNKIIVEEKLDFIIHAASPTSSKDFIEKPVETIDTILNGTKNTLELAREKNVKNYIFLSTMEVYGAQNSDDRITEKSYNLLRSDDVRNCYPLSKFMAENMCFSYSKEFNFSVNILRLTQTFGAGVNYNDGRVFAEFARCAIERRNIILHTKGETKRSYLYSSDAVKAILIVLTKSNNSEIYNVANENTYCSIADMAEIVAKNNNIKVEIELDDINKFGYAPTLQLNLNCDKLREIGWKPKYDLNEMYRRLIVDLKEN